MLPAISAGKSFYLFIYYQLDFIIKISKLYLDQIKVTFHFFSKIPIKISIS